MNDLQKIENAKFLLINIELEQTFKDRLILINEIVYYKKKNKEISESIKVLKKRKTVFEVVFLLLLWTSLLLLLSRAKLHAQFNPKDVSNMVFFVESDNINTSYHVAYCETNNCLNEPNTEGALIADQYCNVTNDCLDGCVRRWLDQSSYVGDFKLPEYNTGRNFGQDDSVKPCYISDCINGKPCIRGGGGVPFATDYTKQDKYLEIQISDFVHLAGEFSIFLLAKPVPQAQDWDYFGQSVSYFRHRVADNYLQLRIPGNFVYRVTPNNSVVLNQWQLIEIHRDVLDKITVYINGIDKTNSPNIILPGTFTVGYLLSAFKTNSQLGEAKSMHGDIASFLIYDKKTSISENNNIRNYFDDEYFAGMGVLNVNTANKQYFRVYPNPIEENIKVSISRKEFETLNVNEFPIFYDVLGKEIRTFVSKFDDHDTITFNIRFAQELNNGFYIMHLGNEVYKLLKN